MSKKIPNEYIVNDEYAELIITSKKHGICKVKIDKEDVERCNKYHWCINLINKSWLYVTNSDVGLLHRFIMKVEDRNIAVDHIFGDTLDNRKENLRLCTITDNCRSRKKNRNNSSGYKGVIWYEYGTTAKWCAYIKVNRKTITLGYFDNLEDAIQARKEAELMYFGEFSREVNPID